MFNFSTKFQGFQGFRDKRKGKIWRLFHATDFESLMYPCFTFCRILGIFPYKINASTFKTSKPGYILSAFTICVLCVYNLINLYDINISKNIIYKTLPRILKRNCFFMVGGFIMIVTFVLNGPRMRLLQTVLKISSRLPPESYQKLSRLIHIKDIFGFFFIIEQAFIYSPEMHFSVFRKILILYIILLEFQISMLYINCVCVLKTCFKQINDKLSNLREIITNDESYLLRRIYSSQRNLFLLKELKALKKQHLAINDTVQMLKIIFSLHLFATTVMTFTQITFNLYIYLRRTRGDQLMSSFETQIYYKFMITSITYYFAKIGLIVWACESGKNQAMEISTTVYDVFNSTNDKQIKYEVD